MSVQIPEDVATLAGGPEPIGPPGEPPLAPPGDPMAGGMGGPPPGGGMPPELMEMLAGGGMPPGAEGGMPPEEAPPEEGGSEVDQLQTILDGIMQYLQMASDDIEKSQAAKGLNIFQSLLASNQKEAEAAAGIGPAQKGMAKSLGGPAGPPAPAGPPGF